MVERHPIVMGIINVTPDSFSARGRFQDPAAAVAYGRRLADVGADILDIGGESTRPAGVYGAGAQPVPEAEELHRVVPVIERLVDVGTALSVDTTKTTVARASLRAGARIINDVSAFRSDPRMAELVAASSAWCCLMHMRGDPGTMQREPTYDDVVSEVKAFLEERLSFAVQERVPEDRVWLDPGIGFGKTLDHNLELLRRLDEIVAIGRPVVIGTSRKSFIGKLTGRPEQQRLAATIATNVLAYERGAAIFRVHDVGEVREELLWAAAVLRSSE